MKHIMNRFDSWEETVKFVADRLNSNIKNFPYKRFYKWYLSKKDIGFPFDAPLIYQCYKAYERMLNNWDNCIVICGMERIGKSTLGIKIGCMIDPKFTKENIVFNLDEYMKQLNYFLDKGEKGRVIQIDEGGQLMFSREAMTSANRTFVKTSMMQGKINATVIICIPNFFLLDDYIRNSRINLLLQITKRGRYLGIMKNGIIKVSKDGAKYKSVTAVKLPLKWYWGGDWNKSIPENFSWDAYELKKDKYMKLYFEEARNMKRSESTYKRINKISEELGVHKTTLRNWCYRGILDYIKIGRALYLTDKGMEQLMNRIKKGEKEEWSYS